jgi:hypothetical protein
VLGGCVYKRYADIIDHRGVRPRERRLRARRKTPNLTIGRYFSSMVQEACDDARRTLRTMRSIRVRES